MLEGGSSLVYVLYSGRVDKVERAHTSPVIRYASALKALVSRRGHKFELHDLYLARSSRVTRLLLEEMFCKCVGYKPCAR